VTPAEKPLVSTERSMIRTRVGALALLALSVAGCGRLDRPVGERPVPSDQVVDFGILFRENCAGCHGADGRFGPAPPLNDPTFLAIVPDATLRNVVAEGREGTPMPAFLQSKGGPLTGDQVKVLATGLKRRWAGSESAQPDLPAYAAESLADSAAEKRGRAVFARACASCHGPDGEGKKDAAGAIREPAFLALISDACLRRLVITGRPDLGMPDFRSRNGRSEDYRPLSSAEIDDLVALIAGWREAGAPPKRSAPRPVPKTAAH
jgi:mono/diheme cytochrome c family protein